MTAEIHHLPDPGPGDAEREHWRRQAVAANASYLRAIPGRYADAACDHPTVAAWVAELVATAEARPNPWVEPVIRSGPSLLLAGVVGVGKTHQACGALRALLTSGVRCRGVLVTAADLYAEMRPRHGVDSEAVFWEYADAGVLALDDLGAAKGSEWTEEINYRLINHRYQRNLPTLVTTNRKPSELRDVFGARVMSRLAEMSRTVVLTGGDRRTRGAR